MYHTGLSWDTLLLRVINEQDQRFTKVRRELCFINNLIRQTKIQLSTANSLPA